MNMAGNLGAALVALAFPYLRQWTGGDTPFFYIAAALNAGAIVLWLAARPGAKLPDSP